MGDRSGSCSRRMAFVVINSHDCVANSSHAIASTFVKLVVSCRCTNNCGSFGEWLTSGSAVRFLSEANSIDIHRNIRFLLALMVNVEMLVSYQFSTRSAGTASETQ